MEDLARSSMLSLIADRIDQVRADPAATERSKVDAVRRAHVPARNKRDLLEPFWRDQGAEGVLGIGQNIRRARFDPLWQTALRSESPAVFLERWHRFEAYGHSRNRIRISQEAERRARFVRYAREGPAPAVYENLLMCGVMIGILEALGCTGLACDMPLADGGLRRIRTNGAFDLPADHTQLSTGSWVIEWQAFAPVAENRPDVAPQVVTLPLPEGCGAGHKAILDRIARLLSRDPSRQWKVAELAVEAGVSTRSLQRKLKDAGLSFSEIVRLVRIQEACRLLRDQSVPLTTVGFCAGFADSAHFSRDFRASLGMPPSEYRASLR